jgi:hypothetical protein
MQTELKRKTPATTMALARLIGLLIIDAVFAVGIALFFVDEYQDISIIPPLTEGQLMLILFIVLSLSGLFFFAVQPIWAIVTEEGVGYRNLFRGKIRIPWDSVAQAGVTYVKVLKNIAYFYISDQALEDSELQSEIQQQINAPSKHLILLRCDGELLTTVKQHWYGTILDESDFFADR